MDFSQMWNGVMILALMEDEAKKKDEENEEEEENEENDEEDEEDEESPDVNKIPRSWSFILHVAIVIVLWIICLRCARFLHFYIYH